MKSDNTESDDIITWFVQKFMDEKLTIEAFGASLAEEVKARVEKITGKDTEVQYAPKIKTNVIEHGISIRTYDSCVAPSISIDDAYQAYLDNEATIEEIAGKLTKVAIENSNPSLKMPELTVEEAKRHVTLNVICAERNQELLKTVPYYMIGDLAVVPRWQIDQNASFLVTKDIAKKIGLCDEEVLQMGMDRINQTVFKVDSMESVLAGMMGTDEVPEMGAKMYVLTNDSMVNGANVLLSKATLDKVYDELGSDVVLLPSSRHECLALKITDNMNPDDLRNMVREVNMTTVDPADFLSDNIYKYDGHKLTVVGESFSPEISEPEMKLQSQSHHMRMGGF